MPKANEKEIIYGDKNGNDLATTSYTYDENTFRLIQLHTTNGNGGVLQDLYYTYDPVGNITEIEDKAIPTKFFNNFVIEPKGLYTYDALYRLTVAQGKEHAGQALQFAQCDNWNDIAFRKTYSPNDDMAWRQYTQRYGYDPVGNILQTQHMVPNGDGNWTRSYAYASQNNRLQETTVGKQTFTTFTYPHHAQHGFITALPHLQLMAWNFKDELQSVAAQKVCTGIDPETTYYVYDSSGQRVRKVTEIYGGGSKKDERVYLGGIEIYKKHFGNHSGLERTTLHVMDDTRRIAMVDTRNTVNDNTDQRTVRFQFSNHLGSASLELDDEGAVISYEEYHPYGTTAYQAVSATIKAAAKRYRYTGMERDEESGLEYHSARYYLGWLGRWLKPDPIGIGDGVNIFTFVNNNPINFIDPNGNFSEEEVLSANNDNGDIEKIPSIPIKKLEAISYSLPDTIEVNEGPAHPKLPQSNFIDEEDLLVEKRIKRIASLRKKIDDFKVAQAAELSDWEYSGLVKKYESFYSRQANAFIKAELIDYELALRIFNEHYDYLQLTDPLNTNTGTITVAEMLVQYNSRYLNGEKKTTYGAGIVKMFKDDPNSISKFKEKEGTKSIGLCASYVKAALCISGAWSTYHSGHAQELNSAFEEEGFTNIIDKLDSPYDAPIGAVIILQYGNYGHIEIKTKEGFISDFIQNNSVLGSKADVVGMEHTQNDVHRKVIGIWVK